MSGEDSVATLNLKETLREEVYKQICGYVQIEDYPPEDEHSRQGNINDLVYKSMSPIPGNVISTGRSTLRSKRHDRSHWLGDGKGGGGGCIYRSNSAPLPI